MAVAVGEAALDDGGDVSDQQSRAAVAPSTGGALHHHGRLAQTHRHTDRQTDRQTRPQVSTVPCMHATATTTVFNAEEAAGDFSCRADRIPRDTHSSIWVRSACARAESESTDTRLESRSKAPRHTPSSRSRTNWPSASVTASNCCSMVRSRGHRACSTGSSGAAADEDEDEDQVPLHRRSQVRSGQVRSVD